MRIWLGLFILLELFAAQVSIAADFAIAETWTMTKQGDWNKVLQIKSTVPEVSRFSFVTFSIMPMNNEIANKFHDDKKVQWPLGIMSDSYFGFRVDNPTPRLKDELVKKIAKFNDEKNEEAKSKVDFFFRDYFCPSDTIMGDKTLNEDDVAFRIEINMLNNAEKFNEIKNLFDSETLTDNAIKEGLVKIYNKFHQ